MIHIFRSFFCLILIYLAQNALGQESSLENAQISKGSDAKPGNKIIIEEMSYNEMIANQKDGSSSWLPPYRQRRKTWGFELSATYSFFEPANYQSFFYEQQDPQNNFDNLYDSASLGYISLIASIRYNSTLGGVSLGLGGGYYKNKGRNNSLDLSLIPLQTRLTWTLDNIMEEPYIAPYAAMGLGYVSIIEEQDAVGVDPNPLPPTDPNNPPTNTNANTNSERRGQFVLFYDVGVLIQLDWMEKSADLSMQTSSGMENAYIKAGMMAFFSNLNGLNPDETTDIDGRLINNRDLTSDLAFHIGFQIEF